MEANDVDKRDARGRRYREPFRDLRVVYKPLPTATPEAEIRVLAEAYRFVLDQSGERPPARPRSNGGANRGGNRE